jgi:hypothetical protein
MQVSRRRHAEPLPAFSKKGVQAIIYIYRMLVSASEIIAVRPIEFLLQR